MPYIAPEVVQEVKKMDLLTYLKNYEPYEVPHVQGGHPLVLHGPEPSFHLGFCCRGVGPAVIDGGTDTRGKQFHLLSLCD